MKLSDKTMDIIIKLVIKEKNKDKSGSSCSKQSLS